MNLAELTEAVYDLTKRPDLVSHALLAIQKATLRAHTFRGEFFYKDLFEFTIDFQSLSYLHQFEYKTLVPRWRAAKYLRKLDMSSTPAIAGKIFTLIHPEAVLDPYQKDRNDVYYIAGLIAQVRSSTEFRYALAACYRYPDITEAGFSSWISEEHPFAIVYNAAAKIFNSVGKKDEFSMYQSMDMDEILSMKNSNIVAEGS